VRDDFAERAAFFEYRKSGLLAGEQNQTSWGAQNQTGVFA
jgi:hypothetical protein